MTNMSYCRFQNTAGDLEDCKDALDNGDASNLALAAAPEELAARDELIRLASDIAKEYGHYIGLEV